MLIAAKASIRRIILPLLLLSAAIPRAGLAQPAAAPPTGATPAPAAQAPKPAPAAALNAAQAKDALDALQDPKKRAQLISVLDAIAKTGIVPAPPPAPAPPPPPAAAEPSLAIPLAPDSLGAYLTWQPRIGRMDSERNCVSNIRPPHGLGYAAAADTSVALLRAARQHRLTGVRPRGALPQRE